MSRGLLLLVLLDFIGQLELQQIGLNLRMLLQGCLPRLLLRRSDFILMPLFDTVAIVEQWTVACFSTPAGVVEMVILA